jgi:membrane fusion protein, heavy metal efflux system
MRKLTFLIVSLGALIACSVFSCSKNSTPEEKVSINNEQNTVTSQKNNLSNITATGGMQSRQQDRIRGQKGDRNKLVQTQKASHKFGIEDAVFLSDSEKKVVEIKTVKADYRSLSSELSAMGKVLANQYRKAIVSYPFPARIAQIDAKVGEWVKEGQKLLVLQSEEVGEAISAFYKAKADYELANVNIEREKRLFEKGVGAKKNYITAEAEQKVSEANLNAAEKKLHILGFTEEEIKTITTTHQVNPIIALFAPINGKIVTNSAVLGGMVDETTEILTIMDPSQLWVDAGIYEKDIAKIRIGQNVAISVPAYPGETFMGKISYISDILQEETHTLTVRTEVENKQYKLKPGMFASLNIALNHHSKALALPLDAILDDKGQKLVFIWKDGKYIPQIVTVGTREDHYVEIMSGVNKGDEVVTAGNFQLKSKLYEEILKKAGVH